jgi:hypothetical protein
MSAIKRGVKKVFRGVKKVLKKIPKPILIAGALLLTGGLAAGGFAAFGAIGQATTLGGKMSAMFGAVGQTMAAGGQAIAGSLGIGSGITGTGATSAFAGATTKGATLGTGVLAQSLGLSAGPAGLQALSQVPAGAGVLRPEFAPSFPSAAKAVETAAQTTGFIGKAMESFNGMSAVGQMAVAQGIFGGMQSLAQSREARRQEKRQDSLGLFGARRRGGEGVIEGDFGMAVRQGFGLDAAPTAQAAFPTQAQDVSQPLLSQYEEDEDEGVMAAGFGLDRGLLAQSQMNMPNFV